MPSINYSSVIQGADAASISNAINDLKRNHFSNGRWLGKRNRYATKTVKNIDADIRSNSIRHGQVLDYVAVSTILHCFDGWTFLANATEALLNGDKAIAIHLAYYAELRAAMSFLASEGIGIFNRKHLWFDINGKANPFGPENTHTVVWDTIEKWSSLNASKGSRILKIIRIQGKPLSEWLNAAGYPIGSPITSHLANTWLDLWSIDIRLLGKDHDFRNEVSYRPQGLRSVLTSNSEFSKLLRFLTSIWETCEPTTQERFGTLDKHLLRLALTTLFKGAGGQVNSAHYRSFINSTVSNIGVPIDAGLKDFLLSSKKRDELPIFAQARKTPNGPHSVVENPLAIFARAFLLLRLATASVSRILLQNLVSSTDLDFWISEIGSNLSLWDPTSTPTYLTDLWADVDIAVSIINHWCDNNPTGNAFDAYTSNTGDLRYLKQFQRMGLWGIGI